MRFYTMFMVASDRQRNAYRLRASQSKASHRVAPTPPNSQIMARSVSAAGLTSPRGSSYSSPCAGSAAAAQFAAAARQSAATFFDDTSAQSVADDARADGQSKRAQAALATAHATIERLQLQLTTLQGREAALRVASEDASKGGRPWSVSDVKRFSAAAKGAAHFGHGAGGDALREMLDQATAAVGRRVSLAIAEGRRARAEQRQVEEEGGASLEDAFSRCKDPAVEHAVRKAASSLMIRKQRVGNKLRDAVRTLEEEAANMQATHAADLRSMATRLAAQRDAVAACLISELEIVESEGAGSLRGQQSEIARLRTEVQSHEETIGTLRGQLKDAECAYWGERRAREADSARTAREAAEWGEERRQLRSLLEAVTVQMHCLVGELADEEASVRGGLYPDEASAHVQTRLSMQQAMDRMTQKHEQSVRHLKREAREQHGAMVQALQTLEAEASERARADNERVIQLQADHERERAS